MIFVKIGLFYHQRSVSVFFFSRATIVLVCQIENLNVISSPPRYRLELEDT